MNIRKAVLNATGFYGYTVDCHFKKAEQVVGLSKGQEVTVAGLNADGDLKLTDCNIIIDSSD